MTEQRPHQIAADEPNVSPADIRVLQRRAVAGVLRLRTLRLLTAAVLAFLSLAALAAHLWGNVLTPLRSDSTPLWVCIPLALAGVWFLVDGVTKLALRTVGRGLIRLSLVHRAAAGLGIVVGTYSVLVAIVSSYTRLSEELAFNALSIGLVWILCIGLLDAISAEKVFRLEGKLLCALIVVVGLILLVTSVVLRSNGAQNDLMFVVPLASTLLLAIGIALSEVVARRGLEKMAF